LDLGPWAGKGPVTPLRVWAGYELPSPGWEYWLWPFKRARGLRKFEMGSKK
jgi:hypothetical protein